MFLVLRPGYEAVHTLDSNKKRKCVVSLGVVLLFGFVLRNQRKWS